LQAGEASLSSPTELDKVYRQGRLVVDDIKRKLATKLLQKFIDGDRNLDAEEVCMDRLGLYGAATNELSDLADQYGDDAFDELSAMYPKWPLERRILLSQGEAKPTLAEVTEHTNTVLENDDHGQFVIMVGKFPLRHRDETIGWVVICEAGIALDREYEIAAILDTEAEASLFIQRKFEMDI
jgi:hypothetical protein